MSHIAAFVEGPFYIVTASLVIFVAVFWFALNHNKVLLLPFIASAVFILAISAALGFLGLFFISLPSLMVGLTIHLLLAAWLLRPVGRLILRR